MPLLLFAQVEKHLLLILVEAGEGLYDLAKQGGFHGTLSVFRNPGFWHHCIVEPNCEGLEEDSGGRQFSSRAPVFHLFILCFSVHLNKLHEMNKPTEKCPS